jgi:hypothetical protein
LYVLLLTHENYFGLHSDGAGGGGDQTVRCFQTVTYVFQLKYFGLNADVPCVCELIRLLAVLFDLVTSALIF